MANPTTKQYIDLTGLNYFWQEAQKKITGELTAHNAINLGDHPADYFAKQSDYTTLNTTVSEHTDTLKTLATNKSVTDLSDKVTTAEGNITALETKSLKAIETLNVKVRTGEGNATENLSVTTSDNTGLLDLSRFATKSEIDTKITKELGNITSFEFEVVGSLPPTGEKGKIYLVADTSGNIADDPLNHQGYAEYIYVNKAWERLGIARVDLKGYSTTDQMNSAIKAEGTRVEDLVTGLTNGQVNTNKTDIAQLKKDLGTDTTGQGLTQKVDTFIDITYAADKKTLKNADTQNADNIAAAKAIADENARVLKGLKSDDLTPSNQTVIAYVTNAVEEGTKSLNTDVAGLKQTVGGNESGLVKKVADLEKSLGAGGTGIYDTVSKHTDILTGYGTNGTLTVKTDINTINNTLGEGFDTNINTVAAKIEAAQNKADKAETDASKASAKVETWYGMITSVPNVTTSEATGIDSIFAAKA